MRFEIECSFERNKATSKIVQDSFRMGEEDEKAIGFGNNPKYKLFCIYLGTLAEMFSESFGEKATDLFSEEESNNTSKMVIDRLILKLSENKTIAEYLNDLYAEMIATELVRIRDRYVFLDEETGSEE